MHGLKRQHILCPLPAQAIWPAHHPIKSQFYKLQIRLSLRDSGWTVGHMALEESFASPGYPGS